MLVWSSTRAGAACAPHLCHAPLQLLLWRPLEFPLSHCRLSSASAATLGQLLAAPGCALASVDMSGNRLDESDAAMLQRAVAGNEVLTSLDLRGNAGIADKRWVRQGGCTALRWHIS